MTSPRASDSSNIRSQFLLVFCVARGNHGEGQLIESELMKGLQSISTPVFVVFGLPVIVIRRGRTTWQNLQPIQESGETPIPD